MSLRSEIETAIAAVQQANVALQRAKAELPADGPAPITGRIIRPGSSSPALQDALNTCEPGDIIALERTWRYEGNFEFTRKLVGPAVILATEDTAGLIDERRIGPSDAGALATMDAGNTMPVLTIEGGGGLLVMAVHVRSMRGQNEVFVCQGAERVSFDRVLIQADGDCKRGIRGNGQHIAVSRSHIAGIVRQGQDSQAFLAWEGAGPYMLTNSYFAGSGENVMFGGADNTAAANNPADIRIENCHFHKPESWRAIPGSVKNLLELKNATRVVIRRCLFENNWTDAQSGWSILFTAMNQDGASPFTAVRDVLFEENWIKGVERGINVGGRGYMHVTEPSGGIVIRRNVVETPGQFIQIQGEVESLVVEDNVADNGYNIATLEKGQVMKVEGTRIDAEYACKTLKFNRNTARHNDYGIHGGPMGTAALDANIQTYEFDSNRFVGIPGHIAFPATTQNITNQELELAKQALLAAQGWS